MLEKCVLNVLELNCNQRLGHKRTQVIYHRKKNENVFKMSKDEKWTCKACKNTVFHCQICKFVGFLLLSSSWSLKLPNMSSKLLTVIQDYFICCVETLASQGIIRFELYPYVITSRCDVKLWPVTTISIFFIPQVLWPRTWAIALVCHSYVIIGLAGLTPLQVKVTKCHLDFAVEHCVKNPTGAKRRKRRKL